MRAACKDARRGPKNGDEALVSQPRAFAAPGLWLLRDVQIKFAFETTAWSEVRALGCSPAGKGTQATSGASRRAGHCWQPVRCSL